MACVLLENALVKTTSELRVRHADHLSRSRTLTRGTQASFGVGESSCLEWTMQVASTLNLLCLKNTLLVTRLTQGRYATG